MTALKAAGTFFLLALGSAGSTCHGQSSTGAGEPAKDTASAPSDVTIPGVDTSMLTPREKKEWVGYVTTLLSPCSDQPVPVAQCVLEKRPCSRCMPAAKLLLKGVRDGLASEQVEKLYHNRFDADRVKNVPLDGSPAKGPESAQVVLIEFADFECPFCGREAPVLDKVVEKHAQDIRFVYKFFPISAHPHGESSARAAIAAMAQGKFWEMHDKLFQNQEHLEQADVDGYAKDIGLNLAKFHADMTSAATNDRLARDRKLADDLKIEGTPTIYINGRDFDARQDIDEWISQELSTSGSAPPPAPAPSASSSATAGNAKAPGK
jgi:protein-disulfide isomerase